MIEWEWLVIVIPVCVLFGFGIAYIAIRKDYKNMEKNNKEKVSKLKSAITTLLIITSVYVNNVPQNWKKKLQDRIKINNICKLVRVYQPDADFLEEQAKDIFANMKEDEE